MLCSMDTKNKNIKVTGIIIKEEDYKEYDKLLTILTKEYGKIKAYAFGIRRHNSKSIGKARLFTFANFDLKVIKDSYQLDNISLIESFEELSNDYNNYCYASYFLELADYFEYENVESDKMIDLIYWTFKALILNKVPNNLIRRIYELKILKYQGIYKDSINLSTNNETLIYTWDFIIKTEPSKLYSFKLKDNIYKLFDDEMKIEMRNNVSKKMKTLEFLK